MILKALGDVTHPKSRTLMLKSVALAIAGLGILWFLLQYVADANIDFANSWLDTIFNVLTSLGLLVAAIYFVPAVTALVAGLFLDDIADVLERHHYGEGYIGRAMAFWKGLATTIQFTGIVIVANLFALVSLLIPGINIVIFLVVNGYLLGREYFELAALRHMDKPACKALRKRHKMQVFGLGLIIAGYLAIPIVNLTTPVFATSLMVHYVAKLRLRKP